MPVSTRASVDLPEAEAPITPSAWPGSSVKSSPRRLGFWCSGGTTVSACTSSRPRGRGRAVGSVLLGRGLEQLLEVRPALPGAQHQRPAADRLLDRRQRAAEQDRAGDHRAGAHLAEQHHVGAEAEHRRLKEEAEGLGQGGELADAVARGELRLERAGPQLLPAGEHGLAHAERLDHLALLADGLGEGVALHRRAVVASCSGLRVSSWLRTVTPTRKIMPASARWPRQGWKL